jgi:hypothetical protein
MRCDQLEGEFREHQEMVQELLMQVARLQSKNVKGSAVPLDNSVGAGDEDQVDQKADNTSTEGVVTHLEVGSAEHDVGEIRDSIDDVQSKCRFCRILVPLI